jgi:hypothetical protein
MGGEHRAGQAAAGRGVVPVSFMHKIACLVLLTTASVVAAWPDKSPARMANPAEEAGLAAVNGSQEAAGPAQESAAAYAARMQWWREAKFGLFLHWGVYSVLAGEWQGQTNHAEFIQITARIPLAQYTNIAATFNPQQFNGEAIYAAGPTPFGGELGSHQPSGKDAKGQEEFVPRWEWRATTKPGKVFIHVFQWPGDGLKLPVLTAKIKRAFLLAVPQTALGVKQMNEGVSLTLPPQAPDPIASVVCLELEQP